jgi:hypothetical protein
MYCLEVTGPDVSGTVIGQFSPTTPGAPVERNFS